MLLALLQLSDSAVTGVNFLPLCCGEPQAIGYAKHRSRSHDAVIRVYDEASTVIETHE